jgi:Flp pilus assembly protein TadG
MVLMLAMIAFAVDVGYLQVARTQLQQSADAAAIAATMELVDSGFSTSPDLTAETASARSIAVQYAAANPICTVAPSVDPNDGNGTSGDVVVGYLQDPSDQTQVMDFTDPNRANAVQVRVQRTSNTNGEVHLFFGRIFGNTGQPVTATATAALLNNLGGFQAPASGGNLGILPFALDEQTWNDMMAGGGDDDWTWDPAQSQISSGADAVREVNLYPQGTGSPGNRGTVDIGGNNNSTHDIARQIVYGVNSSDLAQMPGGMMALNADGELTLNGDTGISAGIKDELSSVKGEPRVIPIFRSVTGPGNNAQYLIVKFVGVRVLDVKLTGAMSNKRVIVQPAHVKMEGGIPGGNNQTSFFVHSPVWLVR